MRGLSNLGITVIDFRVPKTGMSSMRGRAHVCIAIRSESMRFGYQEDSPPDDLEASGLIGEELSDSMSFYYGKS